MNLTYTDLFIDGKWETAAKGGTLEVLNPATGDLLSEVAAGTAEDIDRTVTAARRAYDGIWASISPIERGNLLRRIAAAIWERRDELALLDARDGGRPLRDTRNDLVRARDLFNYYGGVAENLRGSTLPVPHGYLAYTVREPYGVIGAIIPWNLPLVNACLKVAPALAAGNSIVLKPSELTPLSALRLGAIAQEAGLPDGVLNVVPGYGEEAGAALAAHPGVDKIAFTGSTDVGRLIMQAASRNMKGITLELGGKAPNIVFADADLERAARGSLFTVLHHQGQICAAGTRLLVERSIVDEFVDLLQQKMKNLRIGLPEDPSTHVGALISQTQCERVESYVARGIAEGAELVTGGERWSDSVPVGGFYYRPTIFRGVAPDMTIAQEEIFGPVLAVIPFDDEDHAVELANGVIYGLTASIWTRDIGRGHRLSQQIKAGTVWVNTVNVMNVTVPSGGFGQSGIGKEYGIEGAEGYTRLKTIWINAGEHPVGWDV